MLKKITRSLIIPALILLLTATVIPSTVSASTEEIEDPSVKVTITDNEDSSTEVYPDMGISSVCPDSTIQPYSTTIPSKIWNIKTKGKYNFSGSQSGDKVINYTKYKFKGKTSYTIKVRNNGPMTLTVKALRKAKTYATTRISKGKLLLYSSLILRLVQNSGYPSKEYVLLKDIYNNEVIS